MLKKLFFPLIGLLATSPLSNCSPRSYNSESQNSSKKHTNKDKDNESEQSIQVERFEAVLQVIEKALSTGTTLDEKTEYLAANDTRIFVFRVESLLRLYESQLKSEIQTEIKSKLEDSRTDFKELEDILGQYIDSRKLIENATKLSASKTVLDYLVKKEVADRANLQKFLTNKKWLDFTNGPIGRVREKISQVKWPAPDDDYQFLLGQFERILAKIGAKEYDTNDLEGGIHELRKDVRWFILATQAVNGVIALNTAPNSCPVPELAAISLPPDVERKYNTLKPATGAVHTCALSKCLFIASLQFSSAVGDAKDIGQAKVFLADALLKSGDVKTASEADSKADTMVRKTLSDIDIYAEAQKLFDTLKKQKVLESLQGELKSCRAQGKD